MAVFALTALDVLDLLDEKIAETAEISTRATNLLAYEEFSDVGMEIGVEYRLRVLKEIRLAVAETRGIQEHERRAGYSKSSA